jgi:hypothetical protein
MSTEDAFESEADWLLDELCVEFGFCLPPTERDAFLNAPPHNVDAFTDAVFAAEGMDPSLHKQLRRAVRNNIQQRVGHLLDSPAGGGLAGPGVKESQHGSSA